MTNPDPSPQAPAASQPVGCLSIFRWFAWAISDVYAFGGVLYLALKVIFGDKYWGVALFDNAASFMLLPSLPLLAFAAWRRRIRHAAPLAVVAAAYLWLYGPLFLPRIPDQPVCAAAAEGCTVKLRVMAFNLYNNQSDTALVLAEIRRNDPDIIALEEYTSLKADAIAESLGDVYPYRIHYHDGIPGIGLISKYPIVDAENISLGYPQMTHARARIDVNGSQVDVYVVHSVPPAFGDDDGVLVPYLVRGSGEIAELTRRATSGGPAIMMGDFNMADISDDYQVIARAGLIDSFREGGYGFGMTWPARRRRASADPLIRIDYIWHTRDFTATKAWVGQFAGSDHLPVIADLVWNVEGE